MNDDPGLERQLRQLNALYAASLPKKLDEVEAAMRDLMHAPGDRSRMEALIVKLHALAGSAGTFGFGQSGQLARRLEADCGAWLEGASCSRQELAALPASLAALRASVNEQLNRKG